MIEKINRRISALKDPDTRKLIFRRFKSLASIKARSFFDRHPQMIDIGRITIGKGRTFIIAEIGVNHNGKLEWAKQLIDAAADAGADAVKFQKRDLKSTYQENVVLNPNSYDQAFQYLIPILKECEFEAKEYSELKAHAKKRGILLFASAFDEPSVEFLSDVLDPPLYKVASADLTNLPLLERLIKEKKPLILSTGMSTLDEIDEAAAFLHKNRAVFAFLHCQSTYPAPVDALNLAILKKLKNRYGVPVGYSGHELGTDHTVSAVALGASIIERHITLDRNLEGPDHNASLLPDEFKSLVGKIRDFEIAHGVDIKRISRGEAANRLTLRKSLTAAADIPQGTLISRDMVTSKSPGSGLSPLRLYDLVGKKAPRDMKKDELFLEDDIAFKKTDHKQHLFASKWGLKARFFELEKLSQFEPQPDFFEFHMSDKDMDFEMPAGKKYNKELYIHAPEYWNRDIIDLASEDDRVWRQSIEVMQKTIDKTKELSGHFTGTPKIIIHVGGMTIEKHKNPKILLERSKEAFRKLDMRGVEVLPENMPPFGWFFSGLWNINVFCAASEMIEFCKELNLRMCFDFSHAWLYCSEMKIDYLDYIRQVAPLTSHLHISDGKGSQKEGLQIGEGEVPFEKAFEVLKQNLAPDTKISWVPEIWQGHINDYKEFKVALDKLSNYSFLKNL